MHFILHSHKGKGKLRQGKKGKGKAQKGKREKVGTPFCDPIPLGDRTARTHARMHGTTRIDFPAGFTRNL